MNPFFFGDSLKPLFGLHDVSQGGASLSGPVAELRASNPGSPAFAARGNRA